MKSVHQATTPKSRVRDRSALPRKDGGAAAVEFALVLPILLSLVFGIIYFGFIFAAQISLNSSARDAARVGVVKPLNSVGTAKTCPEIATIARGMSKTIGLDPAKIDITVSGPAGTCGSPVGGGTATGIVGQVCIQPATLPTPPVTAVTVTLNYSAVSPVPRMPFGSNQLKAIGVFQCEYS